MSARSAEKLKKLKKLKKRGTRRAAVRSGRQARMTRPITGARTRRQPVLPTGPTDRAARAIRAALAGRRTPSTRGARPPAAALTHPARLLFRCADADRPAPMAEPVSHESIGPRHGSPRSPIAANDGRTRRNGARRHGCAC
ncbi:hypothetical protein ACX833_12545 [Burkholderia pseudomallei]|uniref:hypothetical protein n=2 Tax=Burkholderia pseudomallei TaxID=28450 RepID=UPI001E42D2ED|nr:hypothetical protein [Burkholderia pseudomallei]